MVGESGCGKSTIAKIVSRLTDATGGQVFLDETDVTRCKGKARRDYYKKIQMVFQSVTDSFNPRLKIGSSIADVLRNNGMSRSQAKQRTLEAVGLGGIETRVRPSGTPTKSAAANVSGHPSPEPWR